MRVGIISGYGATDWPGSADRAARAVDTRYGRAEVVQDRIGGHEVVHLGRHGPDGRRLSHQVDHRGNLAVLREAGVEALISLTGCATVNPDLAPGSVIVFDDFYFPGNRLPDGSLCTLFDEPGEAGQGHWVAPRPFSEPLREALIAAAVECRMPYIMHGAYGHVDGPRIATRCEVAALARLGVSAISQTAGPEVVLAGEAGIPMALVGYVTDYANGAGLMPEPVEELDRRMAEGIDAFAALLAAALPRMAEVIPVGRVHRFG